MSHEPVHLFSTTFVLSLEQHIRTQQPKMTASADFLRTLYAQPNSVTEEFYERGVGSIFDKEDDDLRLECWCWSNLTLYEYTRVKRASVQQVHSPRKARLANLHRAKKVSKSLMMPCLRIHKWWKVIQNSTKSLRPVSVSWI